MLIWHYSTPSIANIMAIFCYVPILFVLITTGANQVFPDDFVDNNNNSDVVSVSEESSSTASTENQKSGLDIFSTNSEIISDSTDSIFSSNPDDSLSGYKSENSNKASSSEISFLEKEITSIDTSETVDNFIDSTNDVPINSVKSPIILDETTVDSVDANLSTIVHSTSKNELNGKESDYSQNSSESISGSNVDIEKFELTTHFPYNAVAEKNKPINENKVDDKRKDFLLMNSQYEMSTKAPDTSSTTYSEDSIFATSSIHSASDLSKFQTHRNLVTTILENYNNLKKERYQIEDESTTSSETEYLTTFMASISSPKYSSNAPKSSPPQFENIQVIKIKDIPLESTPNNDIDDDYETSTHSSTQNEVFSDINTNTQSESNTLDDIENYFSTSSRINLKMQVEGEKTSLNEVEKKFSTSYTTDSGKERNGVVFEGNVQTATEAVYATKNENVTNFNIISKIDEYTTTGVTTNFDEKISSSKTDIEVLEKSTIEAPQSSTEKNKFRTTTEDLPNRTYEDESTSSSRDMTTAEIVRVPACEITRISNLAEKAGKTEVNVTWTIDAKTSIDANCNLTMFLICETTNDPNFSWIVPNQSTEVKVKNKFLFTVLANLSEYTNYSCISELKDSSNDVLASRNFSVATLPEVPSEINFTIVNITPFNFSIDWDRPYKLPGNLKMYHITIKNDGPQHYTRKECRSEFEEYSDSFFSESEFISYHYGAARPNHQYQIMVFAEDEAGNSTAISQTIITNSSYSTEPLNLLSHTRTSSDHCNGTDFNSTLWINWELPCDTNGKLDRFEVQIIGNTYRKAQIFPTGWTTTKIVTANRNIRDVFYEISVANLNASSVYSFTITPITEENNYGTSLQNTSGRTSDGCPSKPTIKIPTSYITPSGFTLRWNEPDEYFGEILVYHIEIQRYLPIHFISKDQECASFPAEKYNFHVNSTNLDFNRGFAHFRYHIKMRANTSVGFGKYVEYENITTKANASEPIRNLKITKLKYVISNDTYENIMAISFKQPCNTNGRFVSYAIKGLGRRNGYEDHHLTDIIIRNISATYQEMSLYKPEYTYTFGVEVISENFKSNIVKADITTSAGVPPVHVDKIRHLINEDTPTKIDVILDKNMFDDRNGNVIYYAVFLMTTEDENPNTRCYSFGFWGDNWPMANVTNDCYKNLENILDILPNRNPFEGTNQITFSLGKTDGCKPNDYCHSLLENTNYVVLLRGLTNSTYRDVYTLVKTGTTPSHTVLILSLVFLFILIIVAGIYMYMRRQNLTIFRSISSTTLAEAPKRHVVSVKHFISYYNKITNDPTLLKNQFDDIEDEIKIYKQKSVNTTFAMKPENKRKNRYTNILPYDEYRVKLNIDEDDEISSDYINASYIKGYSGEVEYIASQGPLEHTSRDFWKMVVQENVTVIVMVSQFIEKEKEKCFKYFPNNHENMLISEDIEIKCLTELQFDTYCVRTLLVRKDTKKYSVIHMQYLDWPDFGCPKGTNNMLSFCQDVRDRIELEKGLMIVHCSAGVGRTGTLISLDLLLQSIRKKKEISIFETVMELRRQRTHMVQTDKQYIYIHTCIKDVLENASLYLCDDLKKCEDHIYENSPTIDFSQKTSKLRKHKESVF